MRAKLFKGNHPSFWIALPFYTRWLLCKYKNNLKLWIYTAQREKSFCSFVDEGTAGTECDLKIILNFISRNFLFVLPNALNGIELWNLWMKSTLWKENNSICARPRSFHYWASNNNVQFPVEIREKRKWKIFTDESRKWRK